MKKRGMLLFTMHYLGEMDRVTEKQRRFADFYIETGNAAEAARLARYKKRSARSIGAENLTKPDISAYIKRRLSEMEAGRVASADEIMRFYTSVMRGEVRDQFGFEASLADRLNAAKELMKRLVAADERQNALERLDCLLEEFKNAVRDE